MLYVVFCRIVGLEKLATDQLAATQEVLRQAAEQARQTPELEVASVHSSVYGRLLCVCNPVPALRVAENVLDAAARRGARLAIGITKGRLEAITDLGQSNVTGPAINLAARQANHAKARSRILLLPGVKDKIVEHTADLSPDGFVGPYQGKVKRTKFKYFLWSHAVPPIGALPKAGQHTPFEAHSVVCDIVRYSEMSAEEQWQAVTNLNRLMLQAIGMVGGHHRASESQLWHAPAGDGGVLVFSAEHSGGDAAWVFARQLATLCRGTVDVRLGLATGPVVVLPGQLPVGRGIFRADKLSGEAPTGGFCVDNAFWNDRPAAERQAWAATAAPVDKAPDALLLAPADGAPNVPPPAARPETHSAYQAFLNRRIACWSATEFKLDRRFIQLTLQLNQGEQAQQPGGREAGKFYDLAELLAETTDHRAVVILGAPGSGKSTLLRYHELVTAQAALASGPQATTARLPFYHELNRFKPRCNPDTRKDELPEPMDWHAREWQERAEGLPPLKELVEQGRLVFLLDALNEAGGGKIAVLGLWRDFLQNLDPGNRVVFSCRSLDYGDGVAPPDWVVPQAHLEDLSDGQMEEFLVKYAPEQGRQIWTKLRGTKQAEAFHTPYFLRLLAEVCRDGNIPAGRASLFTRVVRSALSRELARNHPLLLDSQLFTPADHDKLGAGNWKTAFQLPERGRLIPALAYLAFEMQLTKPEATNSREESKPQVRIPEAQALELLGEPCPDGCLKAGADLGLLAPDRSEDEVLFYHQLLQEYFAARQLAAQPQPALVRQEWEATKVRPSLDETLRTLPDSDPLPLLDTSDWEETTVLAAGMAADPAAFVRELMAANLPLAGRAAVQPEITLPEPVKQELQQALLTRSRDEQADLRARIAAGLALGELGDPRFERREGPHGEYLLPSLFVTIPAGRYPIGSEEGDADEKPLHHVQLAELAIAQFPVTNAEWKWFMDAGGYKDERWWESEEDKAWRRGETTAEGPRRSLREYRDWLKADPTRIGRLLEERQLTSRQAENWEKIARMPDQEFEDLLVEWYPGGSQTQPQYWNDAAFNQPAQPVVGVCWHEARAYAAWLSDQTDAAYRLPTEEKWEATARGSHGRPYAYGSRFDPQAGNTFESHIRRTTPVGIFPRGNTLDGICDLSGNVWEWTGSIYQSYDDKFRNNAQAPVPGDARRVLRGGSKEAAMHQTRFQE